MKKFLIILLTASTILNGCKKDKTSEAVILKDYSLSIKDKVWCGQFTNAGETPQNYSVHFSKDNILLWSQLSGNYTGKWSIDNNKLTLNFISPSVTVTADITDDNNLVNITTSTANKVNSGELVPNPNMVLENTVWIGAYRLPPAVPFQLGFMPGSSVVMKIGATTYAAYSYKRGNSGGYIRFKNISNEDVFGVITSAGTMKGNIKNTTNYWDVAKQ